MLTTTRQNIRIYCHSSWDKQAGVHLVTGLKSSCNIRFSWSAICQKVVSLWHLVIIFVAWTATRSDFCAFILCHMHMNRLENPVSWWSLYQSAVPGIKIDTIVSGEQLSSQCTGQHYCSSGEYEGKVYFLQWCPYTANFTLLNKNVWIKVLNLLTPYK